MIREIIEKIDSPSTVISGLATYDLDNAIKLLNKAGFKASVYQDEYIGIKGDNSDKAKSNMKKTLDGKISKGFEISEKCTKSKKEADGGYGDLGAIPTAPSNLGKDVEDPRKKKSLFIVDGQVRENGVD